MYKAIICTICVILLQTGCGQAPEETITNSTPNKKATPTTPTSQSHTILVNQTDFNSLTLPTLTEDIAICAEDNFTFCDPNSHPSDYTKCRYREAEQETIADDSATDIYICTHQKLDVPLKLSLTTYIYKNSTPAENALLCKIYADDDVVGFAMCNQAFCVNKIKEYTNNGFHCNKQ